MSVATFYFLVALLSGDAPALSGLASFETLEACQAAREAISETLASGNATAELVCLSGDALQAIASAGQ